ncbi:TusE/DsrC/DsvC family sulfur relay protein [Pantoea sp. Mhis]|uniref:TusE/DsrC/DsvC family sulfur relay protein n=1 Tax=Pantoea sp. Mhis TaxID=2576759 RepID=UPI0013585E13|nr:TusE/DsrC/DsvC family sulfur relay protein [Pantoea sp. Mhis]
MISIDENIKTDPEGYLKNSANWNIIWAKATAKQEELIMNEEHWEIVYFIRSFYKKYNIVPTMRFLVKAMIKEYGKVKGNSHYLFYLFPKGPIKQATKIAGLPKSVKCL